MLVCALEISYGNTTEEGLESWGSMKRNRSSFKIYDQKMAEHYHLLHVYNATGKFGVWIMFYSYFQMSVFYNCTKVKRSL